MKNAVAEYESLLMAELETRAAERVQQLATELMAALSPPKCAAEINLRKALADFLGER